MRLMSTPLLDRINAIISVPEFEASLEREGSDVMEFQLEWPQYDSFDALPGRFQRAILAAEGVFPPAIPPAGFTVVPHDPKEWRTSSYEL